MNDELARNRERVIQNRTARQAAVDATATNLPTAASRTGAPYLPGDKVFDTVSGQDGAVEAVDMNAKAGSPSIWVRLESRALMLRRAGDLIARMGA